MVGTAIKRIARLLATLGLCSGCSSSDVITRSEFTREFAESLAEARAGLKVNIVRDLELKVTSADGREWTSFLDNAYDAYKQNPKAKTDVIKTYVAASVETLGGKRDGVDSTRIVPVIKDRPWLAETRQALLSRGATEVPEHVFEDFNEDLIVVYAEDLPKGIRYLAPADLKDTKIQRGELRGLACDNLKRLLPKIERHGANGFYMVTAGGDYEASLLLLDSIWSGGQMEVQGDIVVAIPSRDLLLVTGSENAQGIGKLKLMVAEASKQGAYRLTEKLFVYHNGKFEEFKDGAEVSGAPEPAPR